MYQLQSTASGSGEWTYTLLKNFGPAAYVSVPRVIQNGNLYGGFYTPGNGTVLYGVIFEMQPPSTPGGSWTTTYLHRWTDGQIPYNLAVDSDGTIFGTTVDCVSGSCSGTIFRITTR